MQDRYVGDIRDFVKYGLLRWLCRPGPDGAPPPKLGVVWYRVKGVEVDKRKGGGGGGIDCYLHPKESGCHDHAFCHALRAWDKVVADKLKRMRPKPETKTSVMEVEKNGILGKSARFFSEFWTFADRCGKGERRNKREATFDNAVKRARECDLVFLDPDNGIETTGIKCFSSSRKKLKYVLWREARGFYEAGVRSLVLIQFLSRWRNCGSHTEQIRNRRKNLCDALEGVNERAVRTLVFCFRRCSGGANPSPRNGPPLVFFIVPGNAHGKFIDARLKALVDEKSPWSRFFSLGGGDRPRGGCPGPGGPCDACDA